MRLRDLIEDHAHALSSAVALIAASYRLPIPSIFRASRPLSDQPERLGVSTNSARYRELTGTN